MLLDTSAIVAIFTNPAGSDRFERIMTEIADEEVYISMVQLAEIADWATRNQVPAQERVEAVKEMARIVPLDQGICLNAAAIKRRRRKAAHNDFGLVDAIILSTARSIGQRVLTMDEDFQGEEDCVIIS